MRGLAHSTQISVGYDGNLRKDGTTMVRFIDAFLRPAQLYYTARLVHILWCLFVTFLVFRVKPPQKFDRRSFD